MKTATTIQHRNRRTVGPFTCKNPHCQRLFMGFPSNPNNYCSRRCNKRKYPASEKGCETCGTLFWSGAQNRKRYCSVKCVPKKPEQPCLRCGKTRPRSTTKFCSKRCENLWKIEHPKERFLKHVKATNNCWMWQGARNEFGHGQSYLNGRLQGAHRVSYQLFKDDIPRTFQVLHSCDVPECVNPDHLRLGSQKENIADCKIRGREHKGYGENGGQAKLLFEQVKSIRQMLISGITGVALAEKFGVGTSTVYSIKNGRTWRRYSGSENRKGLGLKQWQAILAFYGYRCGQCRETKPLVRDHFIPVSHGGTRNWLNIWPLCKPCNMTKGNKRLDIEKPPHVVAWKKGEFVIK